MAGLHKVAKVKMLMTSVMLTISSLPVLVRM